MSGILKGALCLGIVAATATFSGIASATSVGGVFSTDRFGYTGTVVRYDTEADARAGVNAQETIAIGEDGTPGNNFEHRDAGFGIVNNASAYGSDQVYITGSWWYTTNTIGQGAGWGNVNGNTGVGFMQLYDDDNSTNASVSMDFSNFNGVHWQDFTLSAQGTNATAADDYARFSAYENVHDAVTYLEYDLNIVATGLEGVQTGNVIEANNHATGVNGTFTGLFFFNGDGDGDIYDGFYTVSLDFDMENWAFDNKDDLTGPYDSFFDSQFVAIQPVPEPATMTLLGMGVMGLIARQRRKKA